MKEIPLTQGHVALVDDADYEAVNAFKWHAVCKRPLVYAGRNVVLPGGTRTIQLLHRFLMPEASEQVHHLDGDGRNNQRNNLKPASNQQNHWGFQRKRAGTSSRYRGVSWFPRTKKFTAHIEANGKQKNLGYFFKEADAARAYNEAAIRFFGEFASLNIL